MKALTLTSLLFISLNTLYAQEPVIVAPEKVEIYENDFQKHAVELYPDTNVVNPSKNHVFDADHSGHTHLDEKSLHLFKSGTFYYDQLGPEVKIIRKGNKQTEVWNNGKSKVVMKVEWLSSTEYVLTLLKEVNVEHSSGCLAKGDKLHNVIVANSDTQFFVKSRTLKCGTMTSVINKL